MSEIVEKNFTLHPDKWYIVDAKTDEPMRAPLASQEKAQETADAVMWEKPIRIKQGKDVKWKLKEEEGKLAEAHELITPVLVGTPDERLEALNLWTTMVTTIKKISELPSAENKTSLLRAAKDEAQCAIDRVVNIVHVPIAAPAAASVPAPMPSYESQEFACQVTAERLLELAGVTRRKL